MEGKETSVEKESTETSVPEATIPELLSILQNCNSKERAVALFNRARDRFDRLLKLLDTTPDDGSFKREQQAMDAMCDLIKLKYMEPVPAHVFTEQVKALLLIPSMKERLDKIKPDTPDKETILKATGDRLDALLAAVRSGTAKSPEIDLMNYGRVLQWLEGAPLTI